MPDLNSVPPSPRHLYQGPDQGHQSDIMWMPYRLHPPLPPLTEPSAFWANRQSSRSRIRIIVREPGDPARHGSTSRHTSGEAATSPGESRPLARDGRSGDLASRPNPGMFRDTDPAVGRGPSRLPRPMTAAELHSKVEQESEAMVNFLTRELQSLRDAHNLYVLSNSSSTSNVVSGTEPANLLRSASWTRRRRPSTELYRTQSNTSLANLPARPSITMSGQSASAFPFPSWYQARPHAASISASSSTASLAGGQIMTPSSGSSRIFNLSAERARPDEEVDYDVPPHMQGQYTGPYPLPSLAGTAPPPINSPVGPYALSRSDSTRSTSSSMRYQHPRQSAPQQQYSNRSFSSSLAASAVTTPATSEPSPALIPTTPRYEEVLAYRRNYEAVRRENEALKNRIIELERCLRQRRDSVAIGVPEEEVRVGESAASAGV